MTNTAFSIFTSVPAFYAALFDDLRMAAESIRVQMYSIEEGACANEFKALLMAKAHEGVRVDLMYDSVGSFSSPRRFFDEMEAAGVNVIEYHPVNPSRAPRPFSVRALFRRNHRKLIIIDGRVYYLGGMNIGERFLEWEDIMVRGEGEPVAELTDSFDRIWFRKPARPRRRFKERARQDIQVCDCIPRYQNYPVKRLYISAIKKAKERVWIAQAYFLPRRKLVKALMRAAMRGVDVRVIVPDRSDVITVDLATWPLLARLIDKGVVVERFQERMLHSKVAIIDDHWATVGAANLDSMSFYWNLEMNLVIRDPGIVSELAGIFTSYEDRCRVVEKREPKQRPWSLQLLGRLLYYYSWIL